MPGEYPYTRGVQPTMYRGRFWTMRQYAGFASAEETNERYKYLLGQGQTGLSVAFVWLNSLAAIAGLLRSQQVFPETLPIWLAAVALGALLGTQLGIQRWPVHRLRKSLAIVLLIAAGKLLLG